MTSGRKRLAWRIAASLASGVVLTVGVAWGVALRFVPHQGEYLAEGREGVGWPDPPAPEWPAAADEWSAFGRRTAIHRRWYAFDAANGREYRWDVWKHGWPFLCMIAEEREHRTVGSPWVSARTGLRIPQVLTGLRVSTWASNQLPRTPIWPGFALNTGFYAGAVFLLWSAPGFIRRRRRLRRGQCPACGYDLRATPGKPCPECGS